jgi:hypothetical protein
MDKIFSARVDEAVIRRIGSLARQLKTSKKRVLEDAVKWYAEKMETDSQSDIFKKTCGAWKRKESVEETVRNVRTAFNHAVKRFQQ